MTRKTTTRCASRSPSSCRTTRGSSTRTPSRSARPSSSASAPTEDTTAGIGATDEVASSQPPKLPSCRHWSWASTPLSSLPVAAEVEWLNHNIQQRIAAPNPNSELRKAKPKRTHEAIATSLER
ncbi:unnamed protein product [Miscanthus lutarioriparius]|uniref:Uncharacterized protein n=1 Tax=Miscanthus lutarioriparius TaxID=422564 RepID=A0A811MG46_9POAL|nr:unnamed protein product [Miscanthus lutarioriparius]